MHTYPPIHSGLPWSWVCWRKKDGEGVAGWSGLWPETLSAAFLSVGTSKPPSDLQSYHLLRISAGGAHVPYHWARDVISTCLLPQLGYLLFRMRAAEMPFHNSFKVIPSYSHLFVSSQTVYQLGQSCNTTGVHCTVPATPRFLFC